MMPWQPPTCRKFEIELEEWPGTKKHGVKRLGKTGTLQGTNISPQNGILKMIFLFPRWDMLIPWRVYLTYLDPIKKIKHACRIM